MSEFIETKQFNQFWVDTLKDSTRDIEEITWPGSRRVSHLVSTRITDQGYPANTYILTEEHVAVEVYFDGRDWRAIPLTQAGVNATWTSNQDAWDEYYYACDNRDNREP